MSANKVRGFSALAVLIVAVVALAMPCMAFGDELKAAQLQDQAASSDETQEYAVAGITTQDDSGSGKTSKSRPYANGWYYIQSASGSALMLSNQAGSNAIVKKDVAAESQRWYLKYVAKSKAYTIKNAKTGKYLAVRSGKKGGNAVQLSATSGKSHYWKIDKNSAGGYVLRSLTGYYVLDVNGGKKIKSGANVDVARPKASKGKRVAYQRWQLVSAEVSDSASNAKISSGVYSISLMKSSTKALTVPGNSTLSNKQLVSREYESSLSQKFKISKSTDGYYLLQSLVSGKYLAVNSSKVIQQDRQDDDESQQWRAISLGGGAVSLVNVASGDALAIAGASTKNGAKAVTQELASTPAQRFVLKKRKLIDDGCYYLLVENPNAKNAATVKGFSNEEGAKYDMLEKTENVDCKFEIASVGGNVYTFTNVYSGKKLIVVERDVAQSSKSADAAKWSARMLGDGGLTFMNTQTGLTMRSVNSSGASVRVVATQTGASPQHWYPEKTDSLMEYELKALRKVVQRGSKTNYYFVVDVKKHRMMKFHRKDKGEPWILQDEWVVSTGRVVNGVSKTPLKDSYVYSSRLWLHDTKEHKWSAKYATWWNGAHFHSITYRYHTESVSDGRMGQSVSNGCVRMAIKYCKWIYDHSKKVRGSGVTVWANGKYKL